SIAAFSITLVIGILIREKFWIRLVGGALLIVIGVLYYFKQPKSIQEQEKESEASDFISTLLLTLTNPTTVLSFLVVLSAVGLASNHSPLLTLMIVGGVFAGSMLWWFILTGTVNLFRNRFSDRTMLWMNRIAGLAIGGFGLVTMLLSHSDKH
ncbi:MAG TPA: LysE family transporter, partial [Bryobacteraceae bacterium]